MAKLQAHRGVSSDYPENTMAAFRASVAEGYDYIEFDPKYTSDGEIVILHDHTLDRTARKADGSRVEKGTDIRKVTLAEARSYDYGLWFSEDFRGEQIPLLTDLLDYARESGIPVKIDNVWETFPEEMRGKLFDIVASYGESIHVGFTCARLDTMAAAAARFPYADIHYDGGDLSAERLDEVKKIGRELGLPDILVDKVPIDGLCGKTDEDNLGFTYAELDRYIRTGEIDDLSKKERIDTLHERNLFKLQLMPVFEYKE